MSFSYARVVLLIAILPVNAAAGILFLTGHDPDFHAALGPNGTGAQHIISDSLAYVRNGNTAPILLLETGTANNGLGDHTDSEQGLIASGYTAGTTAGNHYVRVSAAAFATENLSQFSALFIPSDHGGTLTGDDLAALDSRRPDIASYLSSGGGLVALAEDGVHTPASSGPQPALYGFLPFTVGSGALEQPESGNSLTPFGASLGLTISDINGNASHSFFTSTGGLNVVDADPSAHILALAGSFTSVPEPAPFALLALGLGAIAVMRGFTRTAGKQ